MAHLQIRALGKLQLQHDELVVSSFPTHHVEELLGYLLLFPRVKHSRLKLIDLLWPDCSEEQGRGRLNTAVWRLRTIFHTLHFTCDDFLVTARDWVSLSPQPDVQIDFVTFETWERQARAEVDLVRQESLLNQAIALYQGDFCEGIYADWCLLERERLARLHLRLLGDLMFSAMRRGEYETAVEMGQHILQIDPLREEVHRALMHCYRCLGLYAQAIRQFHHCADLLQAELHIMPLPETITLFSQIAAEQSAGLRQNEGAAGPNTAELQAAVAELQLASERVNDLLVKLNL
ncbi:MAG TPA: BTAD domain-containing putative transcriptional regulator [Chloroflexota bacterium]|nr:BTAD domain-containing putative transcriptional regulator [Chloroflexota bacterium]